MKPVLTVIHATHASLGGMRQSGVLERHARTLRAYADYFEVVVYSADRDDCTEEIGVAHRPVPWLPDSPGLRHVGYYMWLVLSAPKMGRSIRAFGSNIPTLPLVKRLARARLVISHQFDYAALAEQTYGPHSLRARSARVEERLGLCAADLVFVTTPALAAEVERKYGLPTELLPNWVDVPEVLPPWDKRTPGAILYAGRLHRIKGVDVLINAFVQVADAYPHAALTICGTGEQEQSLRDSISAGVAERVVFVGRVENSDVLKRMARDQVFVLPTTTSEGHPKALLEAMANGMACVATDVPGNRDMIERNVTGVLVPAKDAAALGKTLSTLLDDGDLIARLGTAAAQAVKGLSFGFILARDVAGILGSPTDASRPGVVRTASRAALRTYGRLPWKPLHGPLHRGYGWYRGRDRRPSVIATVGGVTYDLDLRQYIDASIYRIGCFEPETADLIERVVKPGMTVVDIGANIGAHALPMAKLVGPEGRVMAFEPMVQARRKLERNARLNDFGSRLQILPLGLTDEPTTVTGAFRTSWSLYGEDEPPVEQQLELVRLDEFLQEQGTPWVDFVKLDVDGHECKVLRGALSTFGRCRPMLVTEFSRWTLAEAGDTAEEFVGLLSGLGYEFYVGSAFRERVSPSVLLRLAPTQENTLNMFCCISRTDPK